MFRIADIDKFPVLERLPQNLQCVSEVQKLTERGEEEGGRNGAEGEEEDVSAYVYGEGRMRGLGVDWQSRSWVI